MIDEWFQGRHCFRHMRDETGAHLTKERLRTISATVKQEEAHYEKDEKVALVCACDPRERILNCGLRNGLRS